MAGSLTSATVVIMITVENLFDAPQQIQGFAAEDVFDTSAIESVITSMGVDGMLSGGFVYAQVEQNFMLQANSPSIPLFQQWWSAMQQRADVLKAQMTTVFPSLGLKFNHQNGFLTNYKPLPDAKRTLQPMPFRLTWERITPAPI